MTDNRRQCATRQQVAKALAECAGDVNLEGYVFLENGISTVKVLRSTTYRACIAFVDVSGLARVRS